MVRTAFAFILSALAAIGAAAADERDYVQLVTERRNYAYISAVVEVFGTSTRFKYPEILQTNAAASGRLLCGGDGLSHPDIAVVGARMSADETAFCLGNGIDSITDIRIGFDTLLPVVLQSHGPFALTSRQLFLALAASVPAPSGEEGAGGGAAMTFVANPYRRWSQIDPSLPDRPILVLMPPRGANETDLLVTTAFRAGCDAVEEIAALKDTDTDTHDRLCVQVRADEAIVTGDGAPDGLADRLALIESGFGTLARRSDPMLYQYYGLTDPPLVLAFARPAVVAANTRLAAVAIDGVDPSERLVASGRYPLSRPIFLRVKTSQFAIVPGLRDFVSAFISSEAIGAGGYLIGVGLTPVSEEERESMRLLLASGSGRRVESFGATAGGRGASPAARLRDIERAMWNRLGDSTDPRDFEEFVEYFPDGIFASRARQRAAILARRDSDRDGVADHLDTCGGTERGLAVDANGCALDPQPEAAASATGTAG